MTTPVDDDDHIENKKSCSLQRSFIFYYFYINHYVIKKNVNYIMYIYYLY